MRRSVPGVLVLLVGLTGPMERPAEASRQTPVGQALSPAAHQGLNPADRGLSGRAPHDRVMAEPAPVTIRSGYHHLGATTAGTWTGVMGRLTITDPGVRPGTYDFVAARFMARSEDGTVWLEAGWSENGWLNDGRQRIYSYDTVRRQWTFFDDFRVRPGDQIWIYLESGGPGPGGADTRGAGAGQTTWRAWLWWGTQWRLLAEKRLALATSTTMEQYLEVYIDPAREGGFRLPESGFDNVKVRSGDGALEFWREPEVPSGTATSTGQYCVTWATRFDTWSAADCRGRDQTPPPGQTPSPGQSPPPG